MALRVKTKRLAHQLVRVCAYFRTETPLRDIDPRIKALRTRSPAKIHSTAVHEAGHTALLIALDLDLESVSIIPDFGKGTDGQVVGITDTAVAEPWRFREEFYLRRAMTFYAGEEAVRQLVPTDANPDAGANSDKQVAARLIARQIRGHAASIDFLLSLAKRRCALLVAHYQPEIQALARELEAKLILSGKDARKVFVRSLKRRSGRLLTFKTDPLSKNGVGGDEAFRSFLRGINLPGRPH